MSTPYIGPHQEYTAHYHRLAQDFARIGNGHPLVSTPAGPGRLAVLDLDQDSGYGVGVRLTSDHKLHWFTADTVFVDSPALVERERQLTTPTPVMPPPFRVLQVDHNPIG